jgi:thiol-disulfide isomerase/thioredoxin
MRIRHSLFAALFLIPLCLAPAARAQEDDAAEKTDKQPESRLKGVDLLRAADAKIAKAKTITFKAATKGVGALGTRSPQASGSVHLIRDAKAAPGFRFIARGPALVSGKVTADRTFATSFDGKLVRTLREHDKLVMEAPWSSSTDLMDDGAGWLATWALQWKELVTDRFNEPEMILPNRVEGVASVGGVVCDVIYVDYSELSDRQLFDVWWYLGKDDSLPRRVDMHLVGAGGDGFTITEIERIELDAPISESQLALAIPEGFKVEQAKEPLARQGVAIVKAAGPQAASAAPDWTLKDETGAQQSLSGYRGKVVVMDFWATWCPPCRAVMPSLQKLHDKYKDQGVVVLGMNCWESADAAAHMKENKFTYGLILNADEAAKAYGVSAIPTLYVIGKDGKVVHRSVGAGDEEALEEAIKNALKP